MNKISSRDLHLFVGGALALMGFRALIWLPYHFITSFDLIRIASSIVGGLLLLIGVGILQGRAWGIQWAEIYLWLSVVSGCIVIPVFYYFFSTKGASAPLRSLPDALVSIVLLSLIYWSRSRRFQYEPDA